MLMWLPEIRVIWAKYDENYTPGWVRIVDITRDELLEEFETDSESTGTGKRLDSDNLVKFISP